MIAKPPTPILHIWNMSKWCLNCYMTPPTTFVWLHQQVQEAVNNVLQNSVYKIIFMPPYRLRLTSKQDIQCYNMESESVTVYIWKDSKIIQYQDSIQKQFNPSEILLLKETHLKENITKNLLGQRELKNISYIWNRQTHTHTT